jgi:hypothetical protein
MDARSTLLSVLLITTVPEQSPVVHWTGERLTVLALNAPLRPLLEEVVKRTGMVVSGADRVSGTRTVDVRDVSVTEALSVLLEHVNFLVTREDGVLHVHIHSMAATAPAAVTRPIAIPGLTDQVVTSNRVTSADGADPSDDDARAREQARLDAERQELESVEGLAGGRSLETLEALSTAMQSEHVAVRIRALHLLAARAEHEAFQEIVSAFSDEDSNVVLTASDLLASIPGAAPLEILLDTIELDVAPELQVIALRSLAMRADPDSLPAVRRLAREGDPAIRDLAARLASALESRAKVGGD